jgi:hypothetical protein
MSNDIGEAIAAIVGIAFAGMLLLLIGSEMPNQNVINLQTLGALFIILALVAAIAFLYTIISATLGR